MSIVIYGPQGCGKTKNLKKISDFFHLPVIDNWDFDSNLPDNHIALTHDDRGESDISFAHVMLVIDAHISLNSSTYLTSLRDQYLGQIAAAVAPHYDSPQEIASAAATITNELLKRSSVAPIN